MAVKEMTDEELDAHFRELVTLFIDQGNELAKQSNPENVSLALLHAASRYNAYVVASHAESLAQYERDITGAKSYFQARYSEMLDENLEDYKQVYNKG
ncbi:MAG TPA: DUF3144 domain-containing protein [Marinobacterium sp.]|nr:DUF3144 domain-containing protein [Marinobacterium sp.]